ncbi:MAG: transglutaminase domain-containing protein [Polyangiaceae bacterium]|nr:transglutaminase domain-containing protein [Polyangiaceae bacterium]
MNARLFPIFTLLLPAVLHALAAGRWVGSATGAAFALVSAVVRSRVSLGIFSQRVATLFALTAGGFFGFLEAPERVPQNLLARGWSVMALAGLFGAVFRLWLSDPEGGFFATFMFGLLSVVAGGEVYTGPIFPAFGALYLLLGFYTLHVSDRGRRPLRGFSARTAISAAILLVIAAGATIGFSTILPPIGLRVRDRILTSVGMPTTGLGERMVLGSLDGMLESNEIVARVYGPPVDYLRGVVYDAYQAGQWAPSSSDGSRLVSVESTRGFSDARVRVEIVGGGVPERYLTVLGAAHVGVPEGQLHVDRFGAFRPIRGSTKIIEFDLPTSSEKASFPPIEPAVDDLRRPLKISQELSPILREWTRGASTPRDRINAIADHLRNDLRYSLHAERGPGDPVLDFLLENPQGHCEYFASALAMLARSAGIPARVVAGYRVTERNELGGYSIVRERNAHAWVEVFLPEEGWVTVDATPPDPTGQNNRSKTPFFAALADLISSTIKTAIARFETPSLPEIIAGLSILVVLGLIVRYWQQRKAHQGSSLAAFFQTPNSPPALEKLFAALTRQGIRRDSDEPIEALARRIASGTYPSPQAEVMARAAALLEQYSAWRYGGRGDESALFADIEACTEQLSAF